MTPRLGPRFDEALLLASDLHRSQLRKGSSVPYLSHLMAVAALVLQDGGDEDEAIAALLHDALEDHPERITADEIERRFGSNVRALVIACTDTPPDFAGGDKPPWRERKAAYIEHIELGGVPWRVSLADKLHNARSILRDHHAEGDTVWDRFTASREETLWYYRRLAEAYRNAGAHGFMIDELERVIGELGRGTEEREGGTISPASVQASTRSVAIETHSGPTVAPGSSLPRLIAHADWSSDPRKRWMCVATLAGDQYRIDHPEPVGDASTLLRRLQERAGGDTVVAGFDFPIGVPAAYAERAGVRSFPELLALLGTGEWSRFYDVAETAHEIHLRRPFYPQRNGKKGEITQRQLVDALGVTAMNDLRRACDLPTAVRGAACPIFWTLGGNQVGKAAILGWRDVLTPALRDATQDVALWPFDGDLPDLIARHSAVVVETYPAEAGTHLGMTPPGRGWSKRSRDGRMAQRRTLMDWAARRPVELAPSLVGAIADGFGASKDAEDPFDALVGLLSMLEVILGYRAAGAPRSEQVRKVEGWILGQAAR